MLLVEGSSEMGLFRHLSDHVFRRPSVEELSAIRVIFFLKIFKIESKFRKCAKKGGKVFCF